MPRDSVLLSIHRPSHTTSGWSICRETRIPWLQIERRGSNLPHPDVTTRHQPFQEGLPSDVFSELLFSRQVVLKGFPGCSHAGFLVGKCHPVAKCETLAAPSLHIAARHSLRQLKRVTCCSKANCPLLSPDLQCFSCKSALQQIRACS